MSAALHEMATDQGGTASKPELIMITLPCMVERWRSLPALLDYCFLRRKRMSPTFFAHSTDADGL
jgi:hypothetical protein